VLVASQPDDGKNTKKSYFTIINHTQFPNTVSTFVVPSYLCWKRSNQQCYESASKPDN